jgi:hypothetical protein
MKHACEGLQPERNSRPTHSSEDGKGVSPESRGLAMKEQLSTVVRFCVIAGLSIAVFGGDAEAANKSRRECRQDWRAHKAMYRSEGKTKKAFMKQCRSEAAPPSAPKQGASTKSY